MALHNVLVVITLFQEFDCGQTVKQHIEDDLAVGDSFHWECGCQLSGIAEVVSIGEKTGDGAWYEIKKIS